MVEKNIKEMPELHRTLGLFSLVMMGVGMMIGAGVFVASGLSIAKGGCGSVIIAFALNGLVALFTAMSYAELSSAIPKAGGPYNWVSYGFGKFPAFLTGWTAWLAAIVGGSLYAITFSAYTLKFIKELFNINISSNFINTILIKIVTFLVCITFIYINFKGASKTGSTGIIMTAGQMITLMIICIGALIYVIFHPERLNNFKEFLPKGWGKILIAMGLTYVAFEGFEVICQAGDEAIEPRRNIPKALFYSVFSVVTVYILISIAMTIGVQGGSPLQYFRKGGDPSVRFADSISSFLPLGNFIVTIAVIFSSTSALNATIFSSTRISYALGRDKFLPSFFAKISDSTKIPVNALKVTSLILLFISLLLPIEQVAAGASMLFIFVFMMGNLSVIKIRKDNSHNLKYGYIMPFFPFVTLIAISIQIIMFFKLFQESWSAGPLIITWFSVGTLIYFTYSKKRAISQSLPVILLEQKHVPLRKEYRILLPIANPKNIEPLMEKAIKIALSKNGEIILLNFIRIPEQSPLSIVERYIDKSHELIKKAEDYLKKNTQKDKLIPLHSVIKYGRDFYKCIMDTIKEYQINILIMGWKGKSKYYYFSLGSTIDPIIENVSCNVLVINTREKRKNINKILIPTGGGFSSQTLLAIDIGASLCGEKGEIVLWCMKRKGQTLENLSALLEPLYNYSKKLCNNTYKNIVESGNLVDNLIEESKKYDLLIIGASQQGILKKRAFGDIPEILAEKSYCPVLMVKSPLGIQSIITRWLGR